MTWSSIPLLKHTFLLVALQLEISICGGKNIATLVLSMVLERECVKDRSNHIV